MDTFAKKQLYMKKFVLLALVATLSAPMFAQESSVLSAWEYLETYRREKEAGNEAASIQALRDAKKEIDKACQHPNTVGKSKTWKYRGDVYYEIGSNPSPQLVLDKPGAMDTAMANYLKALVVEKKENGKPVIQDKGDVMNKLLTIANTFQSDGNKQSGNSNFKNAVTSYQRAYDIYTELFRLEPKNTTIRDAANGILQNMVICAINMGNNDQVISLSEQCITNGADSAWVYQNLSMAYSKAGNNTKANEVLTKGKQRFPNDADIFIADLRMALDNKETDRAKALIEEGKTKFPEKKADFILEEVNFYLTANDNEKALSALQEAIAIYQASTKKEDKEILKVLYFNAGIIYDNLAEKNSSDKNLAQQYTEKGLEYYQKTIEVDPNYVAAYNQLANYHVKTGNNYITEANLLPFEKKKEYDELKAKADKEFLAATDILEKGYAIQKDATIKKNLMEMYKRTQQLDKLKALQNEE